MSWRESQELFVLGRAVSHLRRERDVSVEQLAAATGIDRTRIQALEAGRVNPTYGMLRDLAEGLGVRPSSFVIRAEELAARERESGSDA